MSSIANKSFKVLFFSVSNSLRRFLSRHDGHRGTLISIVISVLEDHMLKGLHETITAIKNTGFRHEALTWIVIYIRLWLIIMLYQSRMRWHRACFTRCVCSLGFLLRQRVSKLRDISAVILLLGLASGDNLFQILHCYDVKALPVMLRILEAFNLISWLYTHFCGPMLWWLVLHLLFWRFLYRMLCQSAIHLSLIIRILIHLLAPKFFKHLLQVTVGVLPLPRRTFSLWAFIPFPISS